MDTYAVALITPPPTPGVFSPPSIKLFHERLIVTSESNRPPPQQQPDQQRKQQAQAPPPAGNTSAAHVYSPTPTATPAEPQRQAQQAVAPPLPEQTAGGDGLLPSPPAASAYQQPAFGVNPNHPFAVTKGDAGGMARRDPREEGGDDGLVGLAGGEGASAKAQLQQQPAPPVSEQGLFDGVSEVQVCL